MLSIGVVVPRALSAHRTRPWAFVLVWAGVGVAGALLLGLAVFREDVQIAYQRGKLTLANNRLAVTHERHAREMEDERDRYERFVSQFGHYVTGMDATGIISASASVGLTRPAGPVPDGRTVQPTTAIVATSTARHHGTGVGVNPVVTTEDNVSEAGPDAAP